MPGMKLRWTVIVVISLTWIAAPGAKVDDTYDPLVEFAKWEKPQLLEPDVAIQAAEDAAKITVYEGLPHQLLESRAFRREAERSDVLWVHGVPFYSTPMEINPIDLKLLTVLYLDKKSHEKSSAPKLCGGFHPDYYVVWKKREEWVGAMICLGCAEWISLNDEGYRYEDISEEAHDRLKKILQKYVSQRPKNEIAHTEKLVDLPSMPKEKKK